jgi:hypothetical protein
MKKLLLLTFLPLFAFSQQAIVYYPNGLIKSDYSVGVSRIIYIEVKDHPKLDRSKFPVPSMSPGGTEGTLMVLV